MTEKISTKRRVFLAGVFILLAYGVTISGMTDNKLIVISFITIFTSMYLS